MAAVEGSYSLGKVTDGHEFPNVFGHLRWTQHRDPVAFQDRNDGFAKLLVNAVHRRSPDAEGTGYDSVLCHGAQFE